MKTSNRRTLALCVWLASSALLLPSPLVAQVTEIVNGTNAGVSLDGAAQLAVDGLGNVYVTGAASNNVLKIGSPGLPAQTVTQIIDTTAGGTGSLVGPNGIAVDSAGTVFVAGDSSDNAFEIRDPCGVPLICEIVDATAPLGGTIGVAVDTSGDVYVTGDNSDNLLRISGPCGSSTITPILSIGDGLQTPLFMAFDTAGNLYMTDAGANKVWMITNPGQATPTVMVILTASGDGTNSLDGPSGIAVDPAGNVYVTGENSNNVFMISNPGPAPIVTQIMDSSGDGCSDLLEPLLIAADQVGNVYVTGFASDNAFKIENPGTPTQTIKEIINSQGAGAGTTLDGPAGIVVDALSGNVYVAGLESDNVFLIPQPVGIGANYCASSPNSSGACARISATGSASVSVNNLVLVATEAPVGQPGIFYYGPNQIQAAFGNGLRCVGGSPGTVVRIFPFAMGDANGTMTTAINNTLPAHAQVIPLATLNFQCWYRDPAAGGAGFNLSDALEITLAP